MEDLAGEILLTLHGELDSLDVPEAMWFVLAPFGLLVCGAIAVVVSGVLIDTRHRTSE